MCTLNTPFVHSDLPFSDALAFARENKDFNWDGTLETDDESGTFAEMIAELKQALPEHMRRKRVPFWEKFAAPTK
jgi:hypothetical protein